MLNTRFAALARKKASEVGVTSSLLLHCDGTNGSTSFPDSATPANTLTANGSAQVTTTGPKFGTGSLSCGNTVSD